MKPTTIVLSIAMLAVAAPAMADWQPDKPLEFVVGAGPGGGTDQFGRALQLIIEKYKLVDVPVVVSNKPGGAGAETFVYGKMSGGDPHKLLFGNNNAWLLPLKAKVGYAMDELTPIAAMAGDEFILWVKGDAPYDTPAELIEASKTSGPFTMGGTQSKDGDQILTEMIMEKSGAKFTYVPFKSGSEAAAQLAGGHIVANTNNPSENVGQWKAGAVKPLCVFDSSRMTDTTKVTETMAWSDIPTCAESGLDIVDYLLPRTIFVAGKLTADQLGFYEKLLTEAREKPEWQDYIARTGQTDVFLTGTDFQGLIERDADTSRVLFERKGWLVE